MAARRTASQIATFAALAVAAFGGTVAHSASAKPYSKFGTTCVFVIGGHAFTMTFPWETVRFSGVAQTGGAG